MLDNLILWMVAAIVVISVGLGFALGRLLRRPFIAVPAILAGPFLILLGVAAALQSTIVVETWRDLVEGRPIDGDTRWFFIVAYVVATFPACIGGLVGRIMRGS